MASKSLHPGSDSLYLHTISSLCPQKPSAGCEFMVELLFLVWGGGDPLLMDSSLPIPAVRSLRVEEPTSCSLEHA